MSESDTIHLAVDLSHYHTDYLWKITRRRKVAIKQLLMNSRLVVGVGNIYANEALFRAKVVKC